MGKLKGWEVKRWVGDEGEEGGHPVSPPLHSQGDSWGQTLSLLLSFTFSGLHTKTLNDHLCPIFRQAKEASSTSG